MEISIKAVVEKLEEMFKIFNDKFYNGELQKPILTVSPDQTAGAYGWCTSWKAWKKEGTDGFYEINITAEYLTRPFNDICATMLHEMVHLWNLQNNVKDTSRGCSYHNKTFKTTAEVRGLLIDKDEKYGWTKTSLQEATKDFIKETFGADTAFEIYRTGGLKKEGGAKGKKKSSSIKYVCPTCGMIARMTKKGNLWCGDCSIAMVADSAEEEDTDESDEGGED